MTRKLEDFKSKFCDDCTGACQGMCYGFISAEDQFFTYRKNEYMKDKEILIWSTSTGKFAGLLLTEVNGIEKIILRTDKDSFDEVYHGLNNFILDSIDSE